MARVAATGRCSIKCIVIDCVNEDNHTCRGRRNEYNVAGWEIDRFPQRGREGGMRKGEREGGREEGRGGRDT